MKSYLLRLLNLNGVISASIISRDGFVIESAAKRTFPLDNISEVIAQLLVLPKLRATRLI